MTASEGKVGIFWIFKGELIHEAVPVSKGDPYGDVLNGLTDHCTHWPHIQRARPATRAYEYEQVPRGRVLFRTTDATFLVYGSERFIRDEQQKRLVCIAFNLLADNTVFRADEHYGHVPGMIDE
jgi:hypothetical protein